MDTYNSSHICVDGFSSLELNIQLTNVNVTQNHFGTFFWDILSQIRPVSLTSLGRYFITWYQSPSNYLSYSPDLSSNDTLSKNNFSLSNTNFLTLMILKCSEDYFWRNVSEMFGSMTVLFGIKELDSKITDCKGIMITWCRNHKFLVPALSLTNLQIW